MGVTTASGRTVVVVEESAQTLTPTNSPARHGKGTIDELVADALMIPLSVVVGDEFVYRSPKVLLPEQYHAGEAFFFDRANESFRRTASTWANATCPSPWVDRLLDHEIGGVTGTYNLYEYVEQKRYVAYAIENKVREALGMKAIALPARPLA